MAYIKQNFVKGQILTAEHMNHIEDGIVAAADAQSLGGKAPEYYLQPRNLLDNSDFTNPVNQRGATAYNTNNAYAIDRWIIENGTCWVVENFVSVSAGGYLVQRVPAYVMDETKTYTLATMDVSGSVKVAEAAGMVLFDDGTHGYHTVKILPGEYIWAALYEGSYTADTLPPYVPKGYAVELAECMRYFRKTVLHGVAETAKYIAPVNTFEPPFRIVPTITADTIFGAPGVGGPSASNISFLAYEGFVQEIVDNNSGLTPGILYRLYITASADL